MNPINKEIQSCKPFANLKIVASQTTDGLKASTRSHLLAITTQLISDINSLSDQPNPTAGRYRVSTPRSRRDRHLFEFIAGKR